MKPPWWLHLTVGCVLMLSGIAAWHSWMIATRENPVVVIHRHISECAYLDDQEKQALWNEVLSCEAVMVQQAKKLDAQAEVVNATAELAKAAQNHTAKFGLYANELYNRLEALEKRLKQRRGCGEW